MLSLKRVSVIHIIHPLNLLNGLGLRRNKVNLFYLHYHSAYFYGVRKISCNINCENLRVKEDQAASSTK